MSESGIPAALLRALNEYKFVGHPLWRMADGKDHVRVELTFHKNLPTLPVYKKWAESRRQPAPSAGEWPRQPTAARRPPPTRLTPTVPPGWGHPPCTLSGTRSMTCGLCLKLSHDSSWVPNALCSRNWHALGTRLKAQTFRPICKIQQLTGWTTTLARGLEHARTVSGHAHIPCLGEVTKLWIITRHRFKPTQ